MKILDTPRINKLGNAVAFQSRYGLCLRAYVIPKRTVTAARERMWGFMSYYARAWSAKLTQQQRERWIVAAGNVLSRSSLGQYGPLTGEQFFVQVNLARACISLPPYWEPPAREHPGVSPVTGMSLVNGPQGPRLLLTVTGPVTADVMVFGQAPCSPGRHKRRNVAYLGLLPPPENGVSDITDLYVAKYGPLRPGTKIFIVTRQQKNGWEGPLKETSGTVPREAPEDQELNELNGLNGSNALSEAGGNAASVAKPVEAPQRGSAEASLSLTPYMHTGGTGDAQGIAPPTARCSPAGAERGTQDGKAAKSASSASGGANRASDSPG